MLTFETSSRDQLNASQWFLRGRFSGECNPIWPADSISVLFFILFFYLLPDCENMDGEGGNDWEKTVCKQITAHICVQETVCLKRMKSFFFSSAYNAELLKSEPAFLRQLFFAFLSTMCTLSFEKYRKALYFII